MKIFRTDTVTAITLLIIEFLAGFADPSFFVVFAINLVLIIIQSASKK